MTDVQEVARILVEARRSGNRVTALPAALQPKTVAEAHAIQDATVAMLSETVAGWKVLSIDGQTMRGVILASRVFSSPAKIPAALVPLLGVECEIAFRFERDLPERAQDYSTEEVADAVTALAAFEVVDSRFQSYKDAPYFDRAGDCVSNGAFIIGTARTDWRKFDLVNIKVTLRINGEVVSDKNGGHPAGDPLKPAVALVNRLRTEGGVRKGQVMTTGTYTGLTFAKPGDKAVVEFQDFGSAELQFTI